MYLSLFSEENNIKRIVFGQCMKFQNLTLLGTSHIAKQSLKEVKNVIEKEKPDIIALELDKKRLYALLHQDQRRVGFYDIKRIGIKGFLFSLIGSWAQRKLGQYVGVPPGSEMKTAILLAKKKKIKIALIDQDIEITLRKFSQSLSWKEKWHFLVDILKAIFWKKEALPFDLRKVPAKKVIKTLVAQVKKRYPNIYRVLIVDRNKVMANNLQALMTHHPDKQILAIVGAGHEDDLLALLKKNARYTFSYSFG